jgi:hypothetical protein
VRRAARTALATAALLPVLAGGAQAVAFPQADADHDGYVTFAEAKRAFPHLVQVQFRKCDPNGDGVLTQAEFPLLNNFYWIIDRDS